VSKISKLEVERISDLARLEFAEAELSRFAPTFQQILDYFSQLENINTDTIEPTYHAFHGQNLATPMREDICAESLPHDDAMEAAPEKREGQFRVPKVIE
jgi:aspartyl-tRNA(Asn)/glutamyl-tRNA(Gln) amidotransferase subunit C